MHDEIFFSSSSSFSSLPINFILKTKIIYLFTVEQLNVGFKWVHAVVTLSNKKSINYFNAKKSKYVFRLISN